jgi:hypothetical protein
MGGGAFRGTARPNRHRQQGGSGAQCCIAGPVTLCRDGHIAAGDGCGYPGYLPRGYIENARPTITGLVVVGFVSLVFSAATSSNTGRLVHTIGQTRCDSGARRWYLSLLLLAALNKGQGGNAMALLATGHRMKDETGDKRNEYNGLLETHSERRSECQPKDPV